MTEPGAPATEAPVQTAAIAAAARSPAALPETTEGFPWVSSHEIKKESNPFTERDWRMRGYAWSGFLVRIMLILAALFSVYQFLAAREEKRVERTLALVELWEQPEYQAAQRAVKQRLAALNDKYASLLGPKPTQTELAVYFDRIGVEAMTADGGEMALPAFREEFDRVIYFLNRLASCVDGNLCSRDMADAYFRDYALSFWNYFSGFVAKERKSGSTNFAQPIEHYVQQDAKPAAQ